jgi:hypothetical protein
MCIRLLVTVRLLFLMPVWLMFWCCLVVAVADPLPEAIRALGVAVLVAGCGCPIFWCRLGLRL